MSQSIRISDELMQQAKETAELFHRSPPQQIEHWAAIGRVMEEALHYRTNAAVLVKSAREALDESLAAVETEEGRRRVHAVIARTSGPQKR